MGGGTADGLACGGSVMCWWSCCLSVRGVGGSAEEVEAEELPAEALRRACSLLDEAVREGGVLVIVGVAVVVEAAPAAAVPAVAAARDDCSEECCIFAARTTYFQLNMLPCGGGLGGPLRQHDYYV